MLGRLPGESDFAYHKRLVMGKLEDKSLADIDYAELSVPVYGKQLSSHSTRKMMYGSYITLQEMEKEQVAKTIDSGVLTEIETKKKELQKAGQRFYDQRREYNKLVAKEARWEHLEAALIAAANNLDNTVGRIYDGHPPYTRDMHYSDAEAVLVLSDWHYGMITDNVFNKYNTDICRHRVMEVVNSAIARMQLHNCHRLHVVVLGDLFHGGIHSSARVASEELVCDQLMQASEILAQAIEILSQFVEQTFVHITYGNHARTIQNKHDSIHHDNMERIVPWWLNQRFKDYENVCVASSDKNEFLFLDVCGHEFCASHGDLDSVKTSPRLLTTLFQKTYGKDIEYILLGDKHHRESFNELGVTAMICGSLCGTDDYASDKRLFSHPEQLLLIVNEKDGVDAEYHLRCC